MSVLWVIVTILLNIITISIVVNKDDQRWIFIAPSVAFTGLQIFPFTILKIIYNDLSCRL